MYVFEGGMKRTDSKPMYRKIPFSGLRRLALALTEGSIKYDEGLYDRNWRKANPEAAAACVDHLVEHLWKWLEGDVSEDHLGHLLANANFLCQYEEDGLFTPCSIPVVEEPVEEPPQEDAKSLMARLMGLVKAA